MSEALTGATVELLQQMIRNRCVNDGTAESGHETRNADLLRSFLGSTGLDLQQFEPTADRASLVARIEGSDPTAPSLCLMGHTDVVPVNESGWSRDPFGGELVDGEVWGRGAVDMLNLTASMAVAFRHLASTGFRPRGDLIYFAVADEESGSAHGMQWFADHEPEAIRADYVLTEEGGLHTGPREQAYISINVGEKGVAWRRLRVRGTPGHGSTPYKADNALMTAAAVIQRIGEYKPPPRFHELWTSTVESLGVDDETKRNLLDEKRIDDFLDSLPHPGPAVFLHSCTHTTFSCNTVAGGGAARMKTNVIPDSVEIGVDVRTLPGEGHDDVTAHLRAALGDLYDKVDVEVIMDDPASISRVDNPLWNSLERAIAKPFPTARATPQLVVGFTDARIYRNMGAIAYGTGLFSPDVEPAEFGRRFHGNDERIDVESLRLTTQLWLDVVHDLLG
ncbi:MAG TPA: M20/M25/M40 family metallo-hydrolase [Ilumatobacteraceae bacterium]|nr:M20/M25/M40 family metallo-hydrolase [Ilumatobacteraceae bacterium]